MRRLFTVLFILIASAVYAEDVLTFDKVFFIPTDLKQEDVEDFMTSQREEFQKQKQENKSIEYGANMKMATAFLDEDNTFIFWYMGVCYINSIKYNNLIFAFKDSILKTVSILPSVDGKDQGLSENDNIVILNGEIIEQLTNNTTRLIRVYTFTENDIPYVEMVFAKLGFFAEKRSFLINYKTSSKNYYSSIVVRFFESAEELADMAH